MGVAISEIDDVWHILRQVKDPEIPVLTIADLGILRSVESQGNQLRITITPTYSGCPAMGMIENDIRIALEDEGYSNFEIVTQLQPAWTTDWLSKEGREKLESVGIAPPVGSSNDKSILSRNPKQLRCPICKSEDVKMVSQFGSTACKAHYKCNSCLEPFDYFKCL